MKPIRHLFLTITTCAALLAPAGGWQALAAADSAGPDPGQICISVARLLEQGHYTKQKLNDAVSRRFLNNYFDTLDYEHLFFTQKDIDTFTEKYATALGDDVLLGNPDPAYDIYNLYKKRVEDRIAKIKELINKNDFDFTKNDSVEINRQKAPWPKDEADADRLWRQRIKSDFLAEKLVEHPIEPAAKVLTRRYNQMLENLNEQTDEDVLRDFLTTLALTYDPHSEYLSKSDLENFKINMDLSLVGIGAVLHSEDGYAKIMELVPGGPAERDGQLKVNDRISAVAQGDGQFVDCVGMKLDKVVDMIRGKKGTTVRLQVIASRGTDPAQRKIIKIVRDEIKLKEQAAKADLIERDNPNGGAPLKLGWITLPSFYADMDRSGQPGATSTTTDVSRLLARLKQEGISGLVMDLRNNGGGSLDEAVKLTGLFIKKGPVVQAKDANGVVHVSRVPHPGIEWDGPMIVLTNRLSASASEIFAAALQDYGRAIVVGDEASFGKGTVQTMLEIGKFIPFLGSDPSDAGALKLTIQKFYRIAGGSTQLRGVLSDIKLPSLYDHPDLGERALKDPMPYDEVAPADFDKWDHPLYIKELRAMSGARVASDREFHWISEDLAREKQRIADNTISLNEKTRRAEMAADTARKDERIAERDKHPRPPEKDYLITLDNVDKPQLELVSNEKPKNAKDAKAAAAADSNAGSDEDDDDDDVLAPKDKAPVFDPIRNETLNILSDFIDLNKAPKTASVTQHQSQGN
ncbi:MAG TPA: carboxy terminal-processing peptidase [Chthoniobacteraceae bacterium]|jgi:carboxyl-terminal processing protease|nr:carboxy terminal-processing peptidase [Chthoniobacteraceae bacterium]